MSKGFDWLAMRIFLDGELEQLTDKQRRRVWLRFWGNLTYRQIAETEGISKQAVCQSILTGLKKIKKGVDKQLLNRGQYF